MAGHSAQGVVRVSRKPKTASETEIVRLITATNESTPIGNFSQLVKDLEAAGIVISGNQVAIKGDKVTIYNQNEVALFAQDGKLNANLIDAKTIVTEALKAGNIEAGEAVVDNLKVTNADVSGKITATSGQIAGMKIRGLSLTNQDFNNDACIILQNSKCNTFAGIGGNVASLSTGLRTVAMFINGEKRSVFETNFAMTVGASGAGTNIAIDIEGGFINGLRIRTAYLTVGGKNISTPTKIQKGINSVILAGEGYYELPAMDQNDDGYVIFVKNEYDGSVHIGASQGVTVDGSSKNAFILYDRGSITTNLTIVSRGDAMIFVYHRDVSRQNISSESGCWVQYKCPRDW
jgi:hypothetical protein|uniref:Uncharacterized protein n=1 Tax=Siphoviridae sp. ctaLC6 TaxID=2826387 RepID=A0A8S5MQE1_9CAUD|nr:MAG TPA: hypothetical protein [Siphoviridae sp. ctaLC6]